MPIIEIDALDTLFFRDGKPFSIGEETWADGIFPPSPRVFYGALRTKYFAENPSEFSKANTESDPTQNLKILNFCLKIGGDIQYPLPYNFLSEKKEKEDKKDKKVEKAHLMMLAEKDSNFSSHFPFSMFLEMPKIPDSGNHEKALETVENGFFMKESLENYLKGSESSFPYYKLSEFYVTEPKIGIARDKKSKTSTEGKLYRVNLIRPEKFKNNWKRKPIQFLIQYEGISLQDKGFLKLGAESKIVNYTTVFHEIISKLELDTSSNPTRFKLYFATPCLFSKGSLPSWIDETTLEGEYKGLKLKLLTAAVAKPLWIGGFDMKEKKPKPLRKYVPAGSVYYFEILEGNFEQVQNLFSGQSISEENTAQEGFGICFVGVVK